MDKYEEGRNRSEYEEVFCQQVHNGSIVISFHALLPSNALFLLFSSNNSDDRDKEYSRGDIRQSNIDRHKEEEIIQGYKDKELGWFTSRCNMSNKAVFW